MKSCLTHKRFILYFILKSGATITTTVITIVTIIVVVIVVDADVLSKGRLREGKGPASSHTASQRARQGPAPTS